MSSPPDLHKLASDLTDLPPRMKALPLDDAGRPVPWFAAWPDGKPDHRIVDAGKIARGFKYNLCWVCGQRMGANLSFVIGPMCIVNRVSAEPGSHLDCATWSATHCPFMVQPNKERRTGNIPDATRISEFHQDANPGGCIVYSTRKLRPIQAPDGSILFQLGEPTSVDWYIEGQPAGRVEAEAMFRARVDAALRPMAEEEGADAVAALEQMITEAREWLP